MPVCSVSFLASCLSSCSVVSMVVCCCVDPVESQYGRCLFAGGIVVLPVGWWCHCTFLSES